MRTHCGWIALAAALGLASTAAAQSSAPQTVEAQLSRGVRLARSGKCAGALLLLRKPLGRGIADKDLRRTAGVARVRCAMALNQLDDAADSLRMLTRDFPDDPDVLYLAAHAYSDLSMRASQQLIFKAPGSYQVHQLNAESLEVQGKWDEAAEEYRAALKKNPQAPGIHYLLGRLILSKPKTPTTMEDARREFEAELKINPENATAEFVLGELARQSEKLPEAIDHFSRATKLDAGFADAFLSLGRSLLDSDRVADAVAPLEVAAKLQPDNPSAHFVLGTAYQRAGRKEDAAREFAAHRAAFDKAEQTTRNIKRGVSAGLVDNIPQ